jgi:hypothetical protein
MKEKYKLNQAKKLKLNILALLAFMVSLFGCSDDIADAPVIKVFVNGTAVTESSEPIAVSNGDRVEYRFEITAYTTIADVKAVLYDVLSETVKTPTEQLVGGLTNSLNEVVEGVLIASEDAELRLVVKDMDGNEVSNGFSITVQ